MTKLAIALSLFAIAGCASEAGIEYTLYRTGLDVANKSHDQTQRIHVATFDASQDANYNLANCTFAQDLFNSNQPHLTGSVFSEIKLRYWCEKGAFRR